MGTIKAGTFSEQDFARFAAFKTLMKKSPLFILEAVGGIDSSRLSATVRRMVRQHGIKFVVVDYLQKIKASSKQEKRTYEVAEVSGALKSLAVKTGAAVLALAQLNRESEKDKGRSPRLTDLADSGQIERDGDCIALLHRDRDPNKQHEAVLYVAKQRDGEVGPVSLTFDGSRCKFTNPVNRPETDNAD